jgi:hypothetical protein
MCRIHVEYANRRDRFDQRGPSRAVRGEYRGSGRFPPPRNTKWRVIIRNLSERATWAVSTRTFRSRVGFCVVFFAVFGQERLHRRSTPLRFFAFYA